MLELFHGSVGYLDELLVLGIVVAVGVAIYFVFALLEAKSKPQKGQNEENKNT
jgi:hypothetical protein